MLREAKPLLVAHEHFIYREYVVQCVPCQKDADITVISVFYTIFHPWSTLFDTVNPISYSFHRPFLCRKQEFVAKLEYVARKYDVTVHKIDRFYPSSKTCECGYVNKNLSLKDREWVCPECGKVNDRDLNAAENILRRGISELWSGSKTVSDTASCACTQESHANGVGVCQVVRGVASVVRVSSQGEHNVLCPLARHNRKKTWLEPIRLLT